MISTYPLYRWWRRWPRWGKYAVITPAGVLPENEEEFEYYRQVDEIMGGCGDGNPFGVYRGRAWGWTWLWGWLPFYGPVLAKVGVADGECGLR